MKVDFDQSPYWNKVAFQKQFNHPLDWELLLELVNVDQLILDYGCGYGRLLTKLKVIGYRQLIGVDSSEKMIERARSLEPELDFYLNQSERIPIKDQSVDAILLFAVLTCIPKNSDQKRLISEFKRVLKPNGIIYASDLLVNADNRNINRYQKFEKKYQNYGVFELPEGGVFRHHTWEWIHSLFDGFVVERNKEMNFITMNGNHSKGFQLIVRK